MMRTCFPFDYGSLPLSIMQMYTGSKKKTHRGTPKREMFVAPLGRDKIGPRPEDECDPDKQ